MAHATRRASSSWTSSRVASTRSRRTRAMNDTTRPRDAADRRRSASRRLLPHRYPFLLVDRVIEFEPSKRWSRIKNVTHQRAVLPGPFPRPSGDAGRADHRGDGAGRRRADRSCRAARRAGAAQAVLSGQGRQRALQRASVVPGDQLQLEVELKRMMRNMGLFACARAASTARRWPAPS